MMRLNNRGQSLVLFILLIPVILGIMALVFDLGNALVKKNEIDNVIEMVLESELKNTYIEDVTGNEDVTDDLTLTIKDKSTLVKDIEVLFQYNLKEIAPNIDIVDDIIVVEVNTYVNGIFSNILNIKGFRIESKYEGNLNSKKIEKIK